MDDMKIKQFVAKKLHEGVKLTDIQTQLVDELGCKMTFLELRLLAAELEDVDWSQFDPQEKKAEEIKQYEKRTGTTGFIIDIAHDLFGLVFPDEILFKEESGTFARRG